MTWLKYNKLREKEPYNLIVCRIDLKERKPPFSIKCKLLGSAFDERLSLLVKDDVDGGVIIDHTRKIEIDFKTQEVTYSAHSFAEDRYLSIINIENPET